MNCFESRQLMMDVVDGSLTESVLLEHDRHRSACSECQSRLENFQLLRSAISKQPWKQIPPSLRSPESKSAPLQEDFRTRQSTWKSAPRFMKTGTEGIAIATALLSLIWVIPRVQSVYQWAQSQRLAELFDSDSLFPGAATPEKNRPQKVASRPALSYRTEDEFSEETDVIPTGDIDESTGELPPREEITLTQAGSGGSLQSPSTRSLNARPQEVWRFNLRAASLTDAEVAIQAMLRAPNGPLEDYDIPAAFRAPGGIQFDLLLESRWISPLQDSLRTFIEKNRKPDDEKDPNSSPTTGLTWVRNRSKAPLPPGKARVIIWISQF